MIRSRVLVVLAILLPPGAAPSPAAATGSLSTWATHPGDASVTIHWDYSASSDVTSRYPGWAGFDLLRRGAADCPGFDRLNGEVFPIAPGQSNYGFTWTDTVPATGTTYEYRVAFVDANHQPITFVPEDCSPCAAQVWESCPEFSSPATRGTLIDLGWTLLVEPCDGGCSPALYLEGPWPAELRAYAATGQAVAIYGPTGCGSVEGCWVTVDHYELVGRCPALEARAATWGALKRIYR